MATELATAYVQLVPSMKGSTGQMKNELNGEMSSAGTTSGDSFGKKFISVAKKIIVAAGLGKIISQSIGAGADIEQSLGGLQTMFKDSYEQIAMYANQAWQTAGLSANAYAEQVTSFSAALIKSLGGDTVAAADMANQAMIDMADNSNKFGTSIESIQSAYQGFAKQNYTMLDNLKLGYGGTANEMMRLINDSGVLGYTLEDTSELANVGFATMVEAIHKIQSEMGVTGTTADEAASTIRGSLNEVKAAFTNVMAIISVGSKEGLEALDLSEALDGLGVGISDFAANIVPALVSVFNSLPTALTTTLINAAPVLMQQAPILVNGFATGLLNSIPLLLQTAASLMSSLSSGIATSIPEILANAMPMLLSFSEELLNNAGLLVDAGIELLVNLVQGLMDGLPTLIEYVPLIISNFANIINENMPKILQVGVTIIWELVKGIVKAVPSVIENAGNIVKAIWDVFTAFKWLDLGRNIITGIKNGLIAAKNAVTDTIKNIAKSAFNAVKKFFGIASPSKLMRDEIGKFIPEGMAIGIEANAKSVTEAMDKMSAMTINSAENMLPTVPVSSDVEAQSSSTNNYGGFNINIYTQNNQSAKEIAEEVENIIMDKINAGKKVFA